MIIFDIFNELFFSNIVSTIISGIALTFLLFSFKEFVFNKKNISGEWVTNIKITESSYAKFLEMDLVFKIHLIQKGYEISGTGEKISETDREGKMLEYARNKRVKISIDGYFERKYLKRSKLHLNIIEEGKIRESRSTYFIKYYPNKNKLKGTFISTAADSKGNVEMNKS